MACIGDGVIDRNDLSKEMRALAAVPASFSGTYSEIEVSRIESVGRAF